MHMENPIYSFNLNPWHRVLVELALRPFFFSRALMGFTSICRSRLRQVIVDRSILLPTQEAGIAAAESKPCLNLLP